MENIVGILGTNTLFKDIPIDEIRDILRKTRSTVKKYKSGQIVVFEGDECLSIGIVLAGRVNVQKAMESGTSTTIDSLGQGKSFGDPVLFSDFHHYPSTIVAGEDASVLFLSAQDVIGLCSRKPVILKNFVSLLSNKIFMLNRKIKMLSYPSIRQKIANHIFDEYAKQKTLSLVLSYDRNQLSELLGVPRPSLSRELSRMRDDGLISYRKNSLTILELDKIEQLIL